MQLIDGGRHGKFFKSFLSDIRDQRVGSEKAFMLYFLVTGLLHLKHPFDRQAVLNYCKLLEVQPM